MREPRRKNIFKYDGFSLFESGFQYSCEQKFIERSLQKKIWKRLNFHYRENVKSCASEFPDSEKIKSLYGLIMSRNYPENLY